MASLKMKFLLNSRRGLAAVMYGFKRENCIESGHTALKNIDPFPFLEEFNLVRAYFYRRIKSVHTA